MVDDGVRGTKSGNRSGKPIGRRSGRRARGLEAQERGGYWHIVGTVRAGGRSIRYRKSTGLPVATVDYEAAAAEARRIEGEIIDQATGKRHPGDYVATAAERYLGRPRRRPLGKSSIDIVKEITARFGLQRLNEIEPEAWTAFVDERHANNAIDTRERYLNTLMAFLNWCRTRASRAYLDADNLPEFERDREAASGRRQPRRRVVDLRPDLIATLLDAMHIAIRAQLAAEWSTGARVSSILHGCRLCDLIMAPGREQITFHDTKNGETVHAALHPAAIPILTEYLEWRGRLHDRDGPLFLNPYRRPYKPGSSAQNKKAFNGGKRRAVTTIRRAGAAEARVLRGAGQMAAVRDVIAATRADADLVGQVTQHWFRHLVATEMLASGDLRAAMAQGGWNTVSSVMRYAHDVPTHRRKIVGDRPGFRNPLTPNATANTEDGRN